METYHKLILADSRKMDQIKSNSIQLIVTSPPYPMIEMWDDLFSNFSDEIREALLKENGNMAFELMHRELDLVWKECYRVIDDGGFMCINIGDATRTIDNEFQLFSNHSRILKQLLAVGFQILPEILWRKQTNAPNKFMGSGMLPAGAYITLEHEYILIVRKNGKKQFKSEDEKHLRQESAYFWEERNVWFSDIWEGIKGTNQKLSHESKLRERSAAFPFELVYRLVNMYSIKGDTILDPFVGTGTTFLASLSSERNTIGLEISQDLKEIITERILKEKENINNYITKRLADHKKFIEHRMKSGKEIKYINKNHAFPVVTKQEENLIIKQLQMITQETQLEFKVTYF